MTMMEGFNQFIPAGEMLQERMADRQAGPLMPGGEAFTTGKIASLVNQLGTNNNIGFGGGTWVSPEAASSMINFPSIASQTDIQDILRRGGPPLNNLPPQPQPRQYQPPQFQPRQPQQPQYVVPPSYQPPHELQQPTLPQRNPFESFFDSVESFPLGSSKNFLYDPFVDEMINERMNWMSPIAGRNPLIIPSYPLGEPGISWWAKQPLAQFPWDII